MIDVKSFDIISPGHNHELIDVIEKSWKKSTATTKEQKEKNLHDIFHTFLDNLNKALKNSESADISDLILVKSVYLTEVTGVYDWPRPETLKVSDFHRLTIFLYYYCKYKIGSTHMNMKDISFKAFENIVKFLELLMEMLSFELNEDFLFCVFNDLFQFYVSVLQHNNEENRNKVKEDMKSIIEMIYEETNINNLVKMPTIESSARRCLFIGVLTLIIDFKINQFEGGETSNIISVLNSLSCHSMLLKEISIDLYFDYTLIRSAINFNFDNIVTHELLAAYKCFKTYRKFRKNIAMGMYYKSFESNSKYLLLLKFVVMGIKIDSSILSFLNISDDNLISINLQNLILIKSIIKSNNLRYLNEIGLLQHIEQSINSIVEKSAQDSCLFDLKKNEKILENIYEDNLFFKVKNNNFIQAASSLNIIFRDIKKSIDSLN